MQPQIGKTHSTLCVSAALPALMPRIQILPYPKPWIVEWTLEHGRGNVIADSFAPSHP